MQPLSHSATQPLSHSATQPLSHSATQPEKFEPKVLELKVSNAIKKLNIKIKKPSIPSLRTIVTAIEIGVGITAGVALTLIGGVWTYFYFQNKYYYTKKTKELKESYSQFINNLANHPGVLQTPDTGETEAGSLMRSSLSRLRRAVSCFNRNAETIGGDPEGPYKIGYWDKHNQTKTDAIKKLEVFNENYKKTCSELNEQNKTELKKSATELIDCVMLHIDALVDGSPYAPLFHEEKLVDNLCK